MSGTAGVVGIAVIVGVVVTVQSQMLGALEGRVGSGWSRQNARMAAGREWLVVSVAHIFALGRDRYPINHNSIRPMALT